MKKIISLLTAFIMIFSIVGCSSNNNTTNENNTTNTTESTDNSTVSITDMAGRTVEIPKEINKIYSTDPVGSITVYTINPDLILGWNYKFNDYEKEYILPEYQNLTVYGMGDSVNLEAIINDAPEICLQMGGTSTSDIEKADKLSSQLGIPVVIVSNALEDTPSTYRFMGDILGEKDTCEKLASYCENVINNAKNMTVENPPSVYYGNGENSLETAPEGSVSAEVFKIIGANNVAKVEIESGSRVQISAEQLISWNPEYIFVNGEPKKDITGSQAVSDIVENPVYANIQAVKNNNVYNIPKSPFAWVDRPMGPNRIIGIEWVKSILYPESSNTLTNDTIKEFYNLFYHIDLTNEQIENLMNV